MAWFSNNGEGRKPTEKDATLLRDGLLWLIRRRKRGADERRLPRLVDRLGRFPSPTGLLRELELTFPPEVHLADPLPEVEPRGSRVADREFAGKTVELLRAVADTMADSALMDSELQNSIHTFGDSVPDRTVVADLRRLIADTRSIDAASRRARRREYLRREEVSKLIAALARALEKTAAQGTQLGEGLDELLQVVWAQPDVEGLRNMRQQITDKVRSLASDTANLRQDLEGARSRADALEHIVAEQAERIVDLEAATSRDPLTGVANRRAFDQVLPQLCDLCHRTDTPFSLVILDLDHFKNVNDSHGHPFGDEVLQEVGKALMSVVRQDDVVARVGGEEFAVLLKGAVPNVARVVTERLRASVGELVFSIEGAQVTASAGLASLRPGETSGALYKRADELLYDAKRAGRDRLHEDQQDPSDAAERRG